MLLKAIRRTAATVYPWFGDRLYLRAYTLGTNVHAAIDPAAAVGGGWEKVGEGYFQALKDLGLQPQHSFLDFGCGSLRIGRHVIGYLDPGNYVGVDMAANVLGHGRKVIDQEGLAKKRPTIIRSRGELDFSFVDRTFDYIFAASVFTHLRPQMVAECISNLHGVMHDRSIFVFTFIEGEGGFNGTAFRQSRSFYESASQRYGLLLTVHDEYDLGQRLASLRLRP